MGLHLLLYFSYLTEGLFSLQGCSFSAASVSVSVLDEKCLVSLEILCLLSLPYPETWQEWGKHSYSLWNTICNEVFRRWEVEKTTTNNGHWQEPIRTSEEYSFFIYIYIRILLWEQTSRLIQICRIGQCMEKTSMRLTEYSKGFGFFCKLSIYIMNQRQ